MPSTIRLILGLFQPLLLVLLLAGVPAGAHGQSREGERLRVDGAGSSLLWAQRLGSVTSEALERAPQRERIDGKAGGEPHPKLIVVRSLSAVFDRARLLRISCAFDTTAPPLHRPCTAPPTGPPSLV